MIPVHKYVGETPEAFEFKGTFEGNEVGLFLIKENGELLINADDVSKILGKRDFGEVLSENEELSNAFLDDMNEDYIEYSNAEMLSILETVNKIEDIEIRQSLIKKLEL